MLSCPNEAEKDPENNPENNTQSDVIDECLPFLGDRMIIEHLVKFSEDIKFCDYIPGQGDLGDGICSWTYGVCRSKYENKFEIKATKRKHVSELDISKGTIRMVTDDYDNNVDLPLWRSNVEPGTFRYIPNNGQYRLNKMCQEDRDWYTVRKKVIEKASPTLQALYAQREIKMLLKKDFERKIHTSTDNNPDSAGTEHENSNLKEDLRLVKSASDLYIENIPTRLDVLEKEIERDNALVRRTIDVDENAKPYPTKSKYREQKALKECFSNNSTSSANSTQEETSSQDAFVIKAVGTVERLRPLEKVTPQQRASLDIRHEKKAQKTHRGNTSIDTSSVKSVGHTPNKKVLQTTQESVENTSMDKQNLDSLHLNITPIVERSSTYTENFLNRKTRCNCSKMKLQDIKETKGTFRTSLSSKALCSPDDAYISSDDEICGTKAVLSNREIGNMSHKKTCSHLPNISGRRIQISVTSQRLL